MRPRLSRNRSVATLRAAAESRRLRVLVVLMAISERAVELSVGDLFSL